MKRNMTTTNSALTLHDRPTPEQIVTLHFRGLGDGDLSDSHIQEILNDIAGPGALGTIRNWDADTLKIGFAEQRLRHPLDVLGVSS